MNALPSYSELRQMADAKGIGIATAFRTNGDVTHQVSLALQEFAETYQPLLADKIYTAIFLTYKNWVSVAMQNALDPGSAKAEPPIRVSALEHDQIIHRSNRLELSDDLWRDYVSDLRCLAEVRAKELARVIISGGDTDTTIRLHNIEMAQLGMDYGLPEEDANKYRESYVDTYTSIIREEIELLADSPDLRRPL